jgi:hypothetical protein
MKWNHLPVEGGLYDQHPKLLEDFRYIFAKRGEHEAEQERKRELDRKKQSSGKGAGRVAGGRRR